jgi:hypothetical protein
MSYQSQISNLKRQNKALIFGLALSIAINIFVNVKKDKIIKNKNQQVERYTDVSLELIKDLERCKQQIKD